MMLISPANEGILLKTWTHRGIRVVAIRTLLSDWCFVFFGDPNTGKRTEICYLTVKTAESSSPFMSLRNRILEARKTRVHPQQQSGATSPAGLQNNMNQLVMMHLLQIISLMSLIMWLTQVLRYKCLSPPTDRNAGLIQIK